TFFGSCSAPPPLVAQRPVTTPPTTYSVRNRPSRTQLSSQFQPLAVSNRDSDLYSSSGSMTGWLRRSSSHLRSVFAPTPARLIALSRSGCESGLSDAGASSAARSEE